MRRHHAHRRFAIPLAALAAMLLLFANPGWSAPPTAPTNDQDATSFVTIRYRDRAQLQSLASQFQHLIVDRTARTVRTEATNAQIAEFRRQGMAVTIDQTASDHIRKVQAALSGDVGIESIPGYACYRTVEETYTSIDQMVASKPALASVSVIGPSWLKSRNTGGYDMKVLRLTNSATNASRPNKPVMAVLSSIHAREYTPAELVTRFAEWLVNGHGTDPEATWLLDNFTFYLVLQANPDGRKKAEAGQSWRKNVNNTNGTCSASTYGIDLNRNFPFHWAGTTGGSSGNACAETYRGPTAASEPETQNLVRLVAGTRNTSGVYTGGLFPDRRGDAVTSAAPDDYQGIFFDIHSYSQLVLWSWGDTTSPAPNSAALRTLGRRMAYFNSYRPQQSNELYATDGTTDDTMYGLLGVPSYTIELGVAFFESCTTFQNTTLPRNLSALKCAARNLYAPYRLPSGPDTVSVSASSTTVPAGTQVTITAIVDDGTFNQTNGVEATQNIASAMIYLDKAPWETGAVGAAMTASDGSFNSTRETVTTVLNTTGLSAGRHLVYVQGTDASGKPGTPNAVIVNVTTGGNVPPTANFSFTTSGLTANFTDTSTDSDGTIASRSWNFGDGTTSTTANPSKTYAAAGTYTVTLTVTDNAGATNSKSSSVTVSAAGTQTYTNTTDYTISDFATANSPITVSGRTGNGQASTPVAVNIVHTYIGDLVVSLIAPDGSAYVLHNRTGAGTDNINRTYTVNLSSEVLNGTWNLRVADQASGDVGRIDSWSITF
ncbi:MAG: PKD domain-containing protein [Lysobacteraceae bacterium]|nr:MAG: PKD domain-containing protein [Xanthomonadaceae bacterium]